MVYVHRSVYVYMNSVLFHVTSMGITANTCKGIKPLACRRQHFLQALVLFCSLAHLTHARAGVSLCFGSLAGVLQHCALSVPCAPKRMQHATCLPPPQHHSEGSLKRRVALRPCCCHWRPTRGRLALNCRRWGMAKCAGVYLLCI